MAGDRMLESFVHGVRGLYDGIWLGVLDEDRLAQLDRAFYDDESAYVTDDYNLSGLIRWEQAFLDEYVSPGGRVAVTGAGGGREVAALLSQGYAPIGYEPHPRLAAAGADLVARLGHPGVLRHCGPHGWPGGTDRFDAVVLGWGSYMLISSRARRIALLRDASEATGGRGPVLLSYFEVPPRRTQFVAATRVGRLVRRVRRRPPPVFGDALAPNFAHHFTLKQVREELAAAGLTLIAHGSDGYGWAVGRADPGGAQAPSQGTSIDPSAREPGDEHE